MKILQIATLIPYPPTDGGKLSVFGLLKNLAVRGHEIDFVCYLKYNDFESSYNALKKYCHPHILDFQTDNTIKGAIKNLFSEVPYNASKYYSEIMLKCVSDLLRTKDFDIVQVNHLHLGWLASHIKKITKVPVVMRSQNIETTIMHRYSEQIRNPFLKFFAWLQYKKLLNYELQIYSKFDLCIMISENDLEYLRKRNPNVKAICIPAGIDEGLLKVKQKTALPHSIAHIGHTDWYPNYDSLEWLLTSIFPKVLEKYPDTILYIFGGGNTKNFPIPKNVQKNVRIMGFVEDLWDSLSTIELVVIPLRIGGGIRIKILELLASGNLVLSSSVGKEGIQVKNEQHLLIANTPTEFANQITKVFDGYNALKIIDNGREFIRENYTWSVIVDKFIQTYTYIKI